MKKLLIIAFVIMMGANMLGQRNAIGVRISSDSNFGITLKHRFKGTTTLEGIAHFNRNYISITGLYEKNKAISGGLQWFYGGGAFVGLGGNSNAGIAGIIGLCYKFKDIPIDLSIDWMPRLQIIDNVDFNPNGVGLSIRFTF
jgi:hypothetical protein